MMDDENNTEFIELTISLENMADHSSDTIPIPPVRTEKITIPVPTTCNELKKQIEANLHVPASQQRLYFHSQYLSTSESLTSLHLRSEDVLKVECGDEARVAEMDRILDMIRDASECLEQNMATVLKDNWSLEFHDKIKRVFSTASEINRAVTQAFPGKGVSKMSNSNRVYFINNNGLELTHYLQRQLVSIPWECMTFEMQYMERVTLNILWYLSATLGIRCLVLSQLGLIDTVCDSITRRTIPRDTLLTPPSNQRAVVNPAVLNNFSLADLLGDTMFRGMGVLANLAEIQAQSCRLQVATRVEVIEQMSAALLSHSFNIYSAYVIITCFLNLSYSPQCHAFLTKPQIIHGVLGSSEKEATTTQHDPGLVLLKYFTTLFFGLMCITSEHFTHSDSFDLHGETIFTFMAEFLDNYTVDEVIQAQITWGYSWSTLKPFVSLLYFNWESKINRELLQTNPVLMKLYTASILSGLFCLSETCTRGSNCIDVLEKEDQIDFIVCLPWYINPLFRKDAQVVVELLSDKKKLIPPKLLNIAKAKLATFTGIPPEGISTSSEFINEIYHQFYHV